MLAVLAACSFLLMDTKTWEVPIEDDTLTETISAQLVAQVMHDCQSDSLKPRVQKATCSEIVKGDPVSVACFVRTNIGLFFLTKGYMETTTITYHRFD